MRQSLLPKLLALGVVALAGVVARSATHTGWRITTRKEPPLNPGQSDTAWREALLWTVFSGVVVGLARLLARRGTDAMLRRARTARPSSWQRRRLPRSEGPRLLP